MTKVAAGLRERYLSGTDWEVSVEDFKPTNIYEAFMMATGAHFFGITMYDEKKIVVNSSLMGTYKSVRFWTQTCLHEIAHALAGKGHRHDETWANIARSIGVEYPTEHPTGWDADYLRRVRATT